MKLGIPIWQNRTSPVMDSARKILIFQVEDGAVVAQELRELSNSHPSLLTRQLLDLGIDEIICGAISRPLLSMLTGQGITVYPWISGFIEEVLDAYLGGDFPSEEFLMPGCRGQRMRGRRHDFVPPWSPNDRDVTPEGRYQAGRFPRRGGGMGRGGGGGKGNGKGRGGGCRGGGMGRGGGGRSGGMGRGGGGGRGGGMGRGGDMDRSGGRGRNR